jgi:glutathione synthase
MLSKQKSIAFQINPIEGLHFESDSTLLIANELQARGYKLFCYLPDKLLYEHGKLYAIGHSIELDYDRKTFSQSESKKVLLKDFQVIFIRQIPPFNQEYLTTTYILESLDGPLLLNHPRAVRDVSEKLTIINFPEFIPETIITASYDEVKSFLNKYKTAVLKSLYDCAGNGVVKLKHDDSGIDDYINQLLQDYGYIMLQKFLPIISSVGDKRVMFLDGEVIGAINRKPKDGDFRVNMVQGGQSYSTILTKQEHKVCNIVGEYLRHKGLFLVGIDLIDEKLIEINVTSPTGLVAINRFCHRRVEKIIVDKIEKIIKD